jgi:DNA-binding MarR family transcriptional regulator
MIHDDIHGAAGASAELASGDLPDDLVRLAKRLAALARDLSGDDFDHLVRERARRAPEFDDRVMVQAAQAIYRARQRRLRHFSPRVLTEAGWNMLLDLFVNRAWGERVSTTSLCHAAGVPPTTALRMVGELEREGLVRRYRAPDDQRMLIVEMTAKGYKAMRNYIAEGFSRDDMPAAAT